MSVRFTTLPLWWSLLRGPLAQHPARSLLSILAIALGVALGLAVQTINTSAVEELAAAARVLAGSADLAVTGAREGFDESLYPALARTRGVDVASPVLEVEAKLADRPDALRVLGIDVFRALLLQPGLVAEGGDRMDLLRPDAVFLSPAAAEALGAKVGDTLRFQVGVAVRTVRVAGALSGDLGRGRWGVMDIGAAQTLFAREGRLTRVDLRLAAGIDPAAFARALALPPGVVAQSPESGLETTARMTRAYRVNLNVLALVALFTGALLVLSTQALSVARRRSQIALLRVLGGTRGQITRLLLGEGLVVGVLGAVAGCLAGVGLAQLALRAFGGDLGAGIGDGVAPALRVDVLDVIVFAALGIAAALLGSAGPAWEAARAAPAQALKSGDDQRAFAALGPAWPGLLCLAVGVVLIPLPPVDGLPLFGYLAVALLLLGTSLILPRATRLIAWRLPVLGAGVAGLPVQRLRNYPAQAAVSIAAVVAAVSLMTSMAIMVSSFRDSLTNWLKGMLPADLYLRAAIEGDSAFLDPALQAGIAAVPGIARAEFLRWQQIALQAGGPRITLLARDGVTKDAAQRLPLVADADVDGGGLPLAWITEPAAARFGLAPGHTLRLPLGGRMHAFHVAGVWRDYARQNGAVLIDRAVYRALTGDERANDAGLWLAPGADVATVEAAIRRLPGVAEMVFALPLDIRARSLAIFDRTFLVTYALEAAAVLIGLMGLSSAIGSQVLMRRREFGMLRHVGATRGQIARMLAVEGVSVTAAGLAVGLALGFVISLILIHVVNRQSFHWGMELHPPWAALAAFCVAMLALAALTAVVSGRQAFGRDVVRSVQEDW